MRRFNARSASSFVLPFRDLAFEVNASGGVVADLIDRDEVYRVVQFAVPARVEPVTLPRPAGRLDRRGAAAQEKAAAAWQAQHDAYLDVLELARDFKGEQTSEIVLKKGEALFGKLD